MIIILLQQVLSVLEVLIHSLDGVLSQMDPMVSDMHLLLQLEKHGS